MHMHREDKSLFGILGSHDHDGECYISFIFHACLWVLMKKYAFQMTFWTSQIKINMLSVYKYIYVDIKTNL